MGKGKLAKFADMETYENVFQYPFSVIENVPFEMKGHWHEQYFHNNNPIVLELGCGKGEYTVELAKLYPDMNFIGVDIKGARMWTGATQALNEGLKNVAFLRTNIEIIERFFAEDEVQEIWLTFSDPQMKNPRKRLTSTYFMNRYRKFLVDGGVIHLKTDSNFLFTYSTYMVEKNALPVIFRTEDLYHDERIDEGTKKILAIQTYYEGMWIAREVMERAGAVFLPAAGMCKMMNYVAGVPYASNPFKNNAPIEGLTVGYGTQIPMVHESVSTMAKVANCTTDFTDGHGDDDIMTIAEMDFAIKSSNAPLIEGDEQIGYYWTTIHSDKRNAMGMCFAVGWSAYIMPLERLTRCSVRLVQDVKADY